MPALPSTAPVLGVPPAKGERAPRPWLVLALAAVAAAAVAGAHLAQRSSSQGLQIEIMIASPAPFLREIPRVAQLIALHPDGASEKLISRRYGSAFADPRSTFRFEVKDRHTTEFLFSPAPADVVLGIGRISVRTNETGELLPVSIQKLEPVQQVEILERTPDHLVVKTTGGEGDPLLRFKLDAPLASLAESGWRLRYWGEALALFFGTFAGVFCLARVAQRTNLSWRQLDPRVGIPFAAAAVLILAMAWQSKFNAHPDEYLHFEAAKYFATHWLPPALDAPAVEPSFSHYGVSYLQDLDVSYFLIGKFIAVFSWLKNPETAARLFNVLLFVALSAFLAVRLRRSLAPAVLLISPQIWYVYSYVNGDAWALAISLLAVVQLADAGSLLQRYLQAEAWRRAWSGGALFALLLVLLLFAKRNYYLFLPFIGLVACGQIFLWARDVPTRRLVGRWALIVLAAATLYAPLRLGHAAINRFDQPRLRAEQTEKFAAPSFRPSEIAAGTGSLRIALRNRGATFVSLFTYQEWGQKSFASFCGVYHWMSISSGKAYYLAMGGLYLALLGAIGWGLRGLGWRDILFAAATLSLGLSVILLSAYHSWTADFQPQGRYLFPVLPMLAFLLYRYRETLRSRALYLLLACLFVGSVYSFVFVGLREIPK